MHSRYELYELYEHDMKTHYISSLPFLGVVNTHTHTNNNIRIGSVGFNDKPFVQAEL